MILPRDIYNGSPPERRTRIANNPTLLYSWWCTVFSLVIIVVRLAGRYIRNERLFREDRIMALSIIPLLARMGCVHVVLIYGTNNVDTQGLVDPIKVHHREIGSKLVIASRIFYALFIWTAKFTVSEFLKRMTERFWKKGYEHGLRCIRAFLVLTFIAVFIATLSECQPISHYWQVIPDPGPKCRQGYAHLLTMGVADIITDILLVIFPIPIIWCSGMGARRKISLSLLFSLSFILVIITGFRVPLVIQRQGLQQFRTMLASSEILAATFVSNAIILGSFLRDRGVKKAKYKPNANGSTTDSFDRRSSTRRPTLQRLDSDEDLARSLGYRTNPELAERKTAGPRPAPVADLALLRPPSTTRPFSDPNWKFPDLESGGPNEDADLTTESIDDPMPSPRDSRKVSFFGPEGLLEEGSHPGTAPSPSASVITHDFAVSQPRRGSKASNIVTTNGRAHPQNRRSSRVSQQSSNYETSTRPGQQLQDLGGLLSERHQKTTEHNATSQPTETQPASAHMPRKPARRPSNAPSYGSLPSIPDAGGLLPSLSKL